MKLREFYQHHAEYAFGMSPAEAYELQRALKFDARFPDRYGDVRSGPGGGIDATDFTVTFFLIAALIDGPRKDAGERVWRYWHIVPEGSKLVGWGDEKLFVNRCEFTGATLFGDAVARILTNENLAIRVTEIGVNRATEEAWIEYKDGPDLKEIKRTRFIDEHDERQLENLRHFGTMRAQAVIGGAALYRLFRDVIPETDNE